jgi:hypothetical protein
MPSTSNKGYEVQVTGTNVDTWGDVLNDDVIDIIDSNLGGIVTKTLSNVNVDLSTTESQQLICRLIGTLSGNVLVRTTAKGMTLVENATSGAFAVTFAYQSGGSTVGSAVTVAQGTAALIATDGTNGARRDADNAAEFAAGTSMVFVQAAAPTGWTKQSTDQRAIRVATNSGGGTGGTVDFTTAFASQAISGTVGNTALDETQIPPHDHLLVNTSVVTNSAGLTSSTHIAQNGTLPGGNNNQYSLGGAATAPSVGLSAEAGGGQTHSHTFTGNAVNLAVKYLDVIHATKN